MLVLSPIAVVRDQLLSRANMLHINRSTKRILCHVYSRGIVAVDIKALGLFQDILHTN